MKNKNTPNKFAYEKENQFITNSIEETPHASLHLFKTLILLQIILKFIFICIIQLTTPIFICHYNDIWKENHLDCTFYWITFKILKIEYTEASSVLARLHLDGVTHPHCFSVDIISISFCIGLLSAACLKGFCAVNPTTTYLRLVFAEK